MAMFGENSRRRRSEKGYLFSYFYILFFTRRNLQKEQFCVFLFFFLKILFGKFDGGIINYGFIRAHLERNITISLMGIFIYRYIYPNTWDAILGVKRLVFSQNVNCSIFELQRAIQIQFSEIKLHNL